MVRATTSFLRDFSLLADIETPHNVSLPDSVERLIARICTEKSVLPPNYLARQALDRLGESVSLNILGVIASSRGRVRNFSGFIMHLATSSPIAMAHNAEGPPVGVGDDSDKSSDDWEMVDREPIPSDQEMTTWGRIENLFPTVIGNHEMPILSDKEMTTRGRTENLFPTVVGNDEMSIPSDQETTCGKIENLFPTVTGNYEMPIPPYQQMTTRGRIENLFPTVVGNYEMPILSDQEMTTLGRIENLFPTVVGNDEMVHRRLEKEMDQLQLQDYANYCHSSIPQSTGPSCQRVLSPQMKALGNFEFRRAFLILSYLGRAKLEETVSMGLLRDLTCMPMEAFEFRIWKEFGIKNIKPSDRRKILDWDMGKTHVYHCHVDLQGEVTFKGPFLESTTTHLQRVLGDENILQVKFEEVSQEKKNHFDFDNYYCDVYHRIAEQGIELGLRQYQFLMYKDGGREENKRSGTRSSVKCYFVCTSSGWVRDKNNDFHYGKTVNEIRLSFMHIHTVPSLAKYISRLSLILSKTIKLNIDLSDPELRVETIPDIHCKDGSTVLKGIHTDGTGFISEDLALQCPIYVSKGQIQAGRDGPSPSNNDGPPLLMQVRLFYNGLCAKGTLLVNRLLPKKTIQIRLSMIKVAPDPSMWGIVQPFNSLEVVNTSTRPKKVHLSRYLISLLHFGGVPAEFFLGLLSTALQEAECWHYDRGAALKVALNNEGMDSDHLMARMIVSGMPLDEPFLQYRLGLMLLEERKGLKAGKIPISDSYYLMGTTDPTGQLCANQVCIILGEGQLSGDVLVYKHPGLHPGDVQLLQATFVEGLEKVVGDSKYAIFFPAVGPRSLADEMANSDFDGDIYWVSRHPELLKYFKPSPPWLALEEDSSKKGADNISLANMNGPALETLLFHSFLNNRFKPSYTVGLAAECWLVYMDRLLTPGAEKEDVWPNIEKLINIYYDALDAPKTGKKVEVGKALKVVRYPHFMEKKVGEDFEYHSSSILGLIYDKVQSFKAERLQLTKFVMLPCLSVEVPKNCMDKWRVLYDKYSKEMMEALGIEEKDMKYRRCQEIIDCYKKILYGAWEFKERTRPEDQIQNEALAIYQIVYKKAQTAGKVEKCWFAWRVAGPVLCKYYVSSQDDDDDDVSHVSINVLQKLYELKI